MSQRNHASTERRPRPELDSVDRQIILCLSRDARMSNRALSREIGMSPGAIRERLDRLEEHGVITGYHAWINRAALGFPITALIGVQIEHGSAEFEAALDGLMEVEHVQRVKIVTGEWDLILEVAVRDHEELKDILISDLWTIPGFRHSQTMVVLGVRERPGFWVPGGLADGDEDNAGG